MKKMFLILFCFVSFASCNQLKNNLQGGWVIDQAYYNNEPVIWDLYNNSLDLNKDKTCNLPPIHDFQERNLEEEIGTWKVYKTNENAYLQIYTKNQVFDRTFRINNLRKVRDSLSWGYFMKMTLTADSLRLDCTKALNK